MSEPLSSRPLGASGGSRVGNANAGIVVPQAARLVQGRRSGNPSATNLTMYTGQRGVVEDVYFNQTYGKFTAVRSPRTLGLVFGVLATDLGVLGDDATPTWATLRLPVKYKEGEALPALPSGYAWLRLAPGSLPWAGAWWGCNNGLDRWLDTAEAKVGEAEPLYAYIDHPGGIEKDTGYTRPSGVSGPRSDLIYVQYSAKLTSLNTVSGYLRVESNNWEEPIGISYMEISKYASTLLLYLNRPIYPEYGEILTLTVGDAVGSSYGLSSLGRAAMPVVNRYLPGEFIVVRNPGLEPIEAGQRVVVTSTSVSTNEAANEASYKHKCPIGDVAVLGSGGGGGTNLVVGSVLGGNSEPNAGATANTQATTAEYDYEGYRQTDYQSARGYSYPLPIYYDKPTPNLPIVKDWTKYDLPADFTFATKLPRLPTGLCWVQLARPYSLGTSSWSANLPAGVEVLAEGDNPRPVFAAFKRANRPQDVHVTFDRTVIADPKNKKGFAISTTGSTPLKVLSYTISGKTATVRLSRAIDTAKEVVTITCTPSAATTTSRPPVKSLGAVLTVQVPGDLYTLVLALNRCGLQGFIKGDLVVMSGKAVTITDLKGESRTAYDILHPAARGVRAHTHAADPLLNSYGATYVAG